MNALDKTRIDKSERRLRKWMLVFGISIVLVLGFAGFFVLNQHYSHEDAKHLSAEAACRAIQKNKHVLRKITEHSEEKSIENVKAGITSSTTSIEEVESFYTEAIQEINEINCGRQQER